MNTKRAVFLDRDGVINRYHYNSEFGTVDTPATPEQFELLPGAAEAIAVLNLDSLPPPAAIEEVKKHGLISSVSVVKLPPAGEMPGWFG